MLVAMTACTKSNAATFLYYGTPSSASVKPGDLPLDLPEGAPGPASAVYVNTYPEDAMVLNHDDQPESVKCYIQSLKPGDEVLVERSEDGRLTITGRVP